MIDRLDGVNGGTLVDRSGSDGATAHRGSLEAAQWLKGLLDDVAQLPVPSLFLRRLNKQLIKHRDVLIKAWSPQTRYPEAKVLVRTDPPASIGQCGVSAAWLLPRLSWSRRRRATYCVGYVDFGEESPGGEELHCWVEIGNVASSRRLVIDLTCDQFQALRDTPVLCAPHGRLVDRSIEYKAANRMRFEDLRHDSVWPRYEVLDRATSRSGR